MKKRLIPLLSLCLLLCLTACKDSAGLGGNDPLDSADVESDSDTHTHVLSEGGNIIEHTPGGYCGNTTTEISQADGKQLASFWGGDSVALTDLLLFLDYSGDICKCLPEYIVDTEFGKGYGIDLSKGYVRYDGGQVALTSEQIELIQGIFERQCRSPLIMPREVKYVKMLSGDYEPYRTVDDLISDSDVVVTGTVTDISFMVHGDMTYPPPEIKKDKVLCTVYDLDVSNVYKGKVGDGIKLKMRGGTEDAAYTDEQLSVLGEQPVTLIEIFPHEPTFEPNQTYLLVLREFEDFPGFYYPVGHYQGVYAINSDSDFNALEQSEDPLCFSAAEIISYFVDEQQADNPGVCHYPKLKDLLK